MRDKSSISKAQSYTDIGEFCHYVLRHYQYFKVEKQRNSEMKR